MLELRRYIRRCHELAILGGQNAQPNPMVGSVILENEEIIGEGWHQQYGQAHAEINAINNVQTTNRSRISDSIIFVSLEPCSIHGNTPPCTNAILSENIKKVVISSRDLTQGVNLVSEYILKAKKLDVSYGIGHELGDHIAAPRNIFVSKKRPYIILKWAQSSDGFIAKTKRRTSISNKYTRRYVHQLRSEVGAIVIGNRTAFIDNPSLTTRYYPGNNPLRVVLGNLNPEKHGQLNILNDGKRTVIFGDQTSNYTSENVFGIQVNDPNEIKQMLCNEMYERNIQKMLIEGGAATLQTFIDSDLWDECRIITNSKTIQSGVKAPEFPILESTQSFNILDDRISVFHNIK